MIKGIGTDIVDNSRLNEKHAKRLLTKNEYEIYMKRIDKSEFLGSRFAAKEAIIKATNKQYLCKDIELFNNDDGGLESNISGISVSISHEKKYSIAFAVWEINE